jgi:FtsZ-binding cell division protein ZapB
MPKVKQAVTLEMLWKLYQQLSQQMQLMQKEIEEQKAPPVTQPKPAAHKKAAKPKESYVERQNRILKKYHGAWAKHPWENFMEDIRQGRDDYSDPWAEAANVKSETIS